MKITARVIASGDWWTFDLPRPDTDECFPVRADGKREVSPDGVRRFLSKAERITNSGGDTSFLQCVAVSVIRKVGEWRDRNVMTSDDANLGKARARVARKANRIREDNEDEIVTFANFSLSVRLRADGKQVLKFDAWHDSREVVEKKPWEKYLAMLFAEAAKLVSEDLVAGGNPAIEFSERADGLYAGLLAWRTKDRREIRLASIRRRRPECLHQHGGYCSPRLSICPFYSVGRCGDCVSENCAKSVGCVEA